MKLIACRDKETGVIDCFTDESYSNLYRIESHLNESAWFEAPSGSFVRVVSVEKEKKLNKAYQKWLKGKNE